MITRIQNGFALLGLGAALIVANGCEAEQPAVKIEPSTPPSARPLVDIKKDLTPPVVVKPSAPPTTSTVPIAPKREFK